MNNNSKVVKHSYWLQNQQAQLPPNVTSHSLSTPWGCGGNTSKNLAWIDVKVIHSDDLHPYWWTSSILPPSHHYSSAGSGFLYIAGVATRLSSELSLCRWSGVEEACWFYPAIGGLFACIPFLLCNLFVGNSAYVFIVFCCGRHGWLCGFHLEVVRMVDGGRSLMLWRFSYHLIYILFLFGLFLVHL